MQSVRLCIGSLRASIRRSINPRTGRRVEILFVVVSLLSMAAGCDAFSREQSTTPLKIGLLLNFSGSPEASGDRMRAFDLALKHINDGGGVLGLPVEGIAADATADPSAAVEAARRLVEIEGVHAIVGPNASSAALRVARQVSFELEIPTISPSATSPQLSGVEDNDFFFRTALSDAAQGPVLADLARDREFDNVGLIYQDDAYGHGLATAFEESWNGTLQTVSVDTEQTDFSRELGQSANLGAQALIVIAFEGQAQSIVQQALDEAIYDRFVFGDAAKRISLVKAVGGDRLGGMFGTAGASAPDNAASAGWEASFIAEYGELPVLAYVKETYDATVAIAFAAQAAGGVEGAIIREHLRSIARPPGEIVAATPTGVAAGLSLLDEGRQINFEGAASTLDWDGEGDLGRGHIGIWRFTLDEQIEDVGTIYYDKS